MTVYGRQLASAQRIIGAKGALVTWIKAADAPGPEPEFPSQDGPVEYPVSIVFVPLNRSSQSTFLEQLILGGGVKPQRFGYMAGGQPFLPAVNDQVRFPSGLLLTVVWINLTSPDLTDILYEIGFQ